MTDDPFHGLRVLVVEDVAVLAWLAEEMLEALGCEVVGSAARVSAALALIAASRVDVALLDVNLRDETSYAVADALREKRVPFAFVTAFGRERLSARHRSVPLLGKPYREADLRRVLAETLALGT